MPLLPSELAIIDRLWDWYWTHARNRRGQYELRTSGWGYQLNRLRAMRDSINLALRQGKPAMAVWGPSQTGKSTLISNDVDAGAGPRGEESALHWPDGVPALFVTKDPTITDAIVLNPFAFGSDASGCVTRFRLAKSVVNPQYPVEIQLAPLEQIQHAIAMGYLSECRTEMPNGTKVKFDADKFTNLLDDWSEKRPNAPSTSRTAFEKLCRLLDLLEILILSGEDRYENLRPCQSTIRRQTLEHQVLAASEADVDRFAAQLLWDGREELTTLYAKLQQKSLQLKERWNDKPIYCSLQVASLLLDIDSYQKLTNDSTEIVRVRQLAKALSYRVEPDHILIGADLPMPLIQSDEDFGLLQGLIMELVVPLREEILRAKAPDFCSFLEASDLLDFPGVALAHAHTEHTRIDLSRLNNTNRHKLYTEILKRGKTASIVAAYSRSLTIDGFSVLTRIQRFPAQPAQLLTGITTWWRCLDPEFRSTDLGQRSPMPLNLILTFCAELVEPVVQSGVRDGLDPVFKRLRQLGPLAEPSVITHTLATNYPQFHDGRLSTDTERVRRAVATIVEDTSFQRQFESLTSKESFRQAIENGGTNFVFKVLRDQAIGSRRRQLLSDRHKSILRDLAILIAEAYPSNADAGDRRRTMLMDWHIDLKKALESSTRDDPAEHVSRILRQVFNVDHANLEPIPLHLTKLRDPQLRDYIHRQYEQWIVDTAESKLVTSNLSEIGVRDPAHLSQLLHYLTQSLHLPRLVSWLKENLSEINSPDDSRLYRRYLAVMMTNLLLSPAPPDSTDSHTLHPTEADIRLEINAFGEQERGDAQDHCTNHHYRRIIRPILDLLTRAAGQIITGERPSQPGDVELVLLLQEFPLQFE